MICAKDYLKEIDDGINFMSHEYKDITRSFAELLGVCCLLYTFLNTSDNRKSVFKRILDHSPLITASHILPESQSQATTLAEAATFIRQCEIEIALLQKELALYRPAPPPRKLTMHPLPFGLTKFKNGPR